MTSDTEHNTLMTSQYLQVPSNGTGESQEANAPACPTIAARPRCGDTSGRASPQWPGIRIDTKNELWI